jgi:hypothetical protein
MLTCDHSLTKCNLKIERVGEIFGHGGQGSEITPSEREPQVWYTTLGKITHGHENCLLNLDLRRTLSCGGKILGSGGVVRLLRLSMQSNSTIVEVENHDILRPDSD